MSPIGRDRWKAVSPYLDRAMDMEEDERQAWLARLRIEHPALAADLEALFREREAVLEEGFLEHPATGPTEQISLAGRSIGAYRLLAPIGQGGMGSVWLAERCDGRFEARAAIKLLNLSLLGSGRSRAEARFKREGSLLARLTHPNIARLIDAGVCASGQPYLVLEHVDGQPIDRYCDEHSLDVDARVRLFLDVLAAVAHAHANLVVHRDLKPSNVLVSVSGQVKLLDFGIAKLLEADAGSGGPSVLTREAGAALTPEYAAPEQVTGHQVTTATDVYSLGVLLYLLLGGQHPAGACRSPRDLVRAIVDTEPPRLSDAVAETKDFTADALTANAAKRSTTPDRLRRLLRGDLDTILAKALKKEATERYASVTALADDLQRYLAEEPIRARRDTLGYRSLKFVRRHRSGVASAAGVALLIAALVTFYTVRLTAERDRARIEAEKAEKVSELMTGLLTGADPFLDSDRKELTVRRLLEASGARIEQELAHDPALQAEMLTVMGRTQQRLGAYDKAQPLLERALALARAVDPEHERVGQSLNDLGVLLRSKGDLDASLTMLEPALAMRRRLLGNRHKDVAVTLVELGRTYSSRGTRDRAEPLFREALAIRREVLGEHHRETATSKGDLGLLLWQRNDLDGAERLLRESLESSRKALGDEHPNVASALSNLGLVVADKRDYAGAESMFRESLEAKRKSIGGTHPDICPTLNNLAYALREQGKYGEAIAVLDEALQIARGALGADHPSIANYQANLGRVYAARGEAAAAEPLYRLSLASRIRAFGEADWRVGMTKSLLGAALTSLERYAEAETMLLDARGILKDVPGPQGREARATQTRLVALYHAWGKPEQAAGYREKTP